MPISSGFSYYKDLIPIQQRKPIVRPQIYSLTYKNGLFSNSKATAGNKLPPRRPAAVVKQSTRSDTFTLPTKRNVTNFKGPKLNQTQNGSRQQPVKKSTIINSTTPIEQKPAKKMHKNSGTRPMMRQSNLFMNQGNVERKPVRFANNNNNTYYYPSSSPASAPVNYQKKIAPLADPLPRDALDKSRRMRIVNDEYVIHRRKDSPAYAYTDYQTVSDIPTISYINSLPPVDPPKNRTAPTVIIHSKETHHPDTPTIIPNVSIAPSYSSPPPVIFLSSSAPPPPPPPFMVLPSSAPPPPPAPFMVLPSSATPSYPPTSTMVLPPPPISSYPPTFPMFLPITTIPTQPLGQNFFLPPSSNPAYMSQPLFYPNPPSSAPPPHQQTIISQSSSSSSAPTVPVKTENKTEENNPTFIIQPDTTNKKNVTIQLKMTDEDNPRDRTRSEQVVRVVHEPPYREFDNRYYIESEPKRIIYEQPTRRRTILRRPPPPPPPPPPATQYVYVDESPSTIVRNRRRPHRSEVVYMNNNQPLEYEEEIVYVDDNGNQIEYIYDDKPSYHRRNYRTSYQSPSTRIIYE
ncbi:unnamed protein product [Rotaria sordida]|uniref:Uncharacterized protein n=1 Tax=Rotaria sordida TaxID=392033 RepID=A0A819AXZ6_9BILA|nr:unnamed protein product [Rotaria sordida]CAF3792498.1 unnamed protein product [Rotaria sordida]